jgi:DNA polymerase-3 subunit delta
VKQAGGTISNSAVQLLTGSVGNDLSTLANEIEKLVLYKSPETIEPADVQLLCPNVAEASIFDLVDAIGGRQGRQSAQLLHAKLAEGTDPFQLFAMVIRQFRLLIQVKELVNEGLRPPDISQTLNLHSFVVGKLYAQCQNFSMTQLEQIYAHLLESDVAAKTGRVDLVTSLDLLVAGLAN